MAKRLNTFISDHHFRRLKVLAAEHGTKIGATIERLIEDVKGWPIGQPLSDELPASGSRPDPITQDRLTEDRTANLGDSAALSSTAVGLSSQEERSENPPVPQSVELEIVECDVCGQALPEDALKLHRRNCLRAKLGYWDQKAFKV